MKNADHCSVSSSSSSATQSVENNLDKSQVDTKKKVKPAQTRACGGDEQVQTEAVRSESDL